MLKFAIHSSISEKALVEYIGVCTDTNHRLSRSFRTLRIFCGKERGNRAVWFEMHDLESLHVYSIAVFVNFNKNMRYANESYIVQNATYQTKTLAMYLYWLLGTKVGHLQSGNLKCFIWLLIYRVGLWCTVTQHHTVTFLGKLDAPKQVVLYCSFVLGRLFWNY